MNIRIKLFATLREALGESEFDLSLATLAPGEKPVDVAAVKALLSKRGVDWHDALNQPNVVHALNHKVVFTDAPIAEGDELAFFPPMTGG